MRLSCGLLGRRGRSGFFPILAAAALVLSGCQSSVAVGHPRLEVLRGGTVYFTRFGAASSTPNWIFPFISGNYETYENVETQQLMYRPLYWFGQIKTPSPSFDEQLSLALAPTSSNGDKTVVIRLKGWRFSNGQRVNAQSVIFWMNMLKAEPSNWGASLKPEFPYNVTSYSAPEGPLGDLVTISFDRRYSTSWLLYNELSQITPMPEAWDVTSLRGSPGSGRCGVVGRGQMNGSVTTAACDRVWDFDTDDGGTLTIPQMSGNPDTYGSNPLWQVVDGPWRMSSYDASNGEVTFVPNRDYSGPQRPIISRFVEVPYTSDAAMLAALARGGSGAPDVAGVSTQDLPMNNGPPGVAGANLAQLAGRYNLDLSDGWGIFYDPMNFNSTGDHGTTGALFRQPYIRQALQLLVNQPELIRTAARGYGVPDYGPVPAFPKNPFLTEQETANPYPFDPAKAVLLLRDHGWKIYPEGADRCTRPGTAPSDCGKGIKRGTRLRFTVLYANDLVWHIQLALAESSAWAKAGIQAAPEGELLGSVECAVGLVCKPVGSWEMASWGGWAFYPDYLPTGENIFAGGSATNVGGYENTNANRLITETLVSKRLGYLFDYENYLATQVPVIWQPDNSLTVFEVSKNLGGVSPINALITLTPEYWYWKTSSRS